MATTTTITDPQDVNGPETRRLEPAQWLLIAVGAAVLLTGILNSTPLLSANDRSRWATVWSLVERGTYQIDAIDNVSTWSTIDKVLHEGHRYSTKPPLQSTVVAGLYWVLKRTCGYDLFAHTAETTRIILLFINWLPTTIAFVVMARLLNELTAHRGAKLFALASLCFGTLITGYGTTFNNHSPAALCLIFSLAPLIRISNGAPASGWQFAMTGFWAALTCCLELPAALFGLATFFLLVRRSPRLTALWYVPAALLPLSAYFVTNYLATGGWKPFYMYYGTEKYLFTIDGIPSYWHTPHGMDQNLDSPACYFLHCTIGHHGVFSLTPIFLLTLATWLSPSWFRLASFRLASFRLAVVLGGVLSMAVLGFYLTRTENYNYGGNTFGLRWMIWLTPFWVIALLPALERLLARRSGMCVAVLLLVVSTFSATSAAANPWASSWLFNRLNAAGWIDYSDPRPVFPFQRRLQTWFAELPDAAGAWVEFESSGSGSDLARRRVDTVRLTSRGASVIKDRNTETISVAFNAERADGWSADVQIDRAAFYAGRPVSEQVVSVVSDGSLAVSRDEVLTVLRGLPRDRDYRPGVVRYLKTPVRKDAFRCQRAASQVEDKTARGQTVRFRSDLWLCDDIPFGTARFELTEVDHRTGETLTRRQFLVTGFGG